MCLIMLKHTLVVSIMSNIKKTGKLAHAALKGQVCGVILFVVIDYYIPIMTLKTILNSNLFPGQDF